MMKESLEMMWDIGVHVRDADEGVGFLIYPIVDKFVIMDRGRKVSEPAKADLTPEEVVRTLSQR